MLLILEKPPLLCRQERPAEPLAPVLMYMDLVLKLSDQAVPVATL